ncbi:MAG: flagellar hook-associated protein FlgK [Alphaproteobacteria bacterium]|nr:flagellar hook-associated protein FlgK [Alphaproteobacteria bacterium]
MGLGGLDIALSGLRVSQQQLNTIASNVSNVNTDGYTRKILPQSNVVVGGELAGVRGEAITRFVDLNLERDFWTQVSTVKALDTKATYLNRIQEFHGPPEVEASIAAAVGALRDSFSALSDSPEDDFLQRAAVDQAGVVAKKMNDFSALITGMRNDAQDEMGVSIQKINDLLVQIAGINKQVKQNLSIGKTSAALEDQRDKAIKELSNEVEISFFIRGDGVLVVQTQEGVQLADERPETIYFNKGNIGASSYFPVSINGIYVGGDPRDFPTAIEVTQTDLGGRLGALIELRDDILPRQLAEIDELAHKMALRFEAQGLRLFTDGSGQIPADTAPVPSPPAPVAIPVPYIGFATEIQVNDLVKSDHSLVQSGTVPTDLPIQEGSNEVVRRVATFVFGETDYQQATGTLDVQATATGGVTLQEWLGLYSQNQITGTTNLSAYSDVNALLSAGSAAFLPSGAPPLLDEFQITFEEPRLGIGPETITVSLTDAAAIPLGAGQDALDQIIAEINNEIAALPVDPAFVAVARRSPYGQLIIESRGNVTLDASTLPTGMRAAGMTFLGLSEESFTTEDPYFDVQIGNDPPVRVTIEPGDTETELLDKLEYDSATQTGVPGLFADIDATTGFLTLRPGNDDSNGGPVFGGDIRLFGGPFESDGTGGIGAAAGDGILASLFGNSDPVSDVLYKTSIPFRSVNLGPGADIDTGAISTTDLLDYAQKMVNRQTEEINLIDAQKEDETTFHDLLQRRLLDESGVNIEEELSHMILIQTSFAAASRAVTAIDEMFQDLLAAI